MTKYTFDCGCQVDILDEKIKENDGLPSLKIPYEKLIVDLNYNNGCKATWDMISCGRTKGVFQLESALGKNWCERLKPTSLEEMSALISLIRPGCLNCVSSDTKITVRLYNTKKDRRRNYTKFTIKELYEQFTRNHWKYDADIISLDERNLKLFTNKIKNIIYNGKKIVVKPKFKTTITKKKCKDKFYSLECTLDHKLLTHDRGWIQLSDIKIGERVAIISNGNGKRQRKNAKHIKNKHSFKDVCFINYKYKCIYCDWNQGSLDTNHIDGNRRTNNSPENLSFLCPNHHRLYSENKISKEELISERQKYTLKKSEDILWAEYIGYEYIGVKDVYDISVDGDNHNFIAGNVVVHNCMMEGKSMTQHYIDRKFDREECTAPYKALEQCGLDSTYYIIVYQEQIMRICKELAGFSDVESDNVRKGIGKKDAELLFSMQEKFMEGCDKVGLITKDEAKQIFDWFKESARYSFNKSHGVGYGVTGYITAWTKYHFPLHFFCSWIKYAKYRLDPYEEIRELISEAKLFNIGIETPSINNVLESQDLTLHKDHIKFGFNCIKKIGEAALNKLISEVQEKENILGKQIKDWTWFEIATQLLPNISSNAVNGLICGGVLDKYNLSRNNMISDYEMIKKLTVKQLSLLKEKNNFQDGLQNVFDGVGKNQKQKISDIIKLYLNPPTDMKDSISWTIVQEKELYGVPITYQPIEVLKRGTNADTTCKEFVDGKNGEMSIGVEIEDVRPYKIKNGKNKGRYMAYIKVSDGTATIDTVIFTDAFAKYENILYKNNLVFLYGERSDKNSFMIRKVEELL